MSPSKSLYIRTPAEHKAACVRASSLMDAKAGTPESRELRLLATMIDRYERKAFPTRRPTARAIKELRLEQRRKR